MNRNNIAIIYTMVCLVAAMTPAFAVATGNKAIFYHVRDYGAKGDGQTTDQAAINKAIDAAAAAGGGTVYFSAGNYLSFSIHLKSNITLYLDQGATLLAADAKQVKGGYDAAEPNEAGGNYQDYGHSHWHNSLIWGENLENISILGPGRIYGRGLTREGNRTVGVGNKAIALKLCRNVILKDFSILMGGHFAILATGVDNLTISNLKIDANRDGMDIDCCRNVRVSDCSVNSPWDDAICLKSSFGLGYARSTENVTITNCQVSGYDKGTFLDGTYKRVEGNSTVPDKAGVTGRIKFGTESNGGFKNITISNCVFEFCRGLALETVDGALLEDVTITNITMRDIVSSPIFLRLGARMRGPAGIPVGHLRRINISNINVYNADVNYACVITGIPGHEIEDVQLHNINIMFQGGGTPEMAATVAGEKEKEYPDPVMFKPTPAYGFFIRHVNGLTMSNVQVNCMAEDARPAYIFHDVRNAGLFAVTGRPSPQAAPFIFGNSDSIQVIHSAPVRDTVIGHISHLELR